LRSMWRPGRSAPTPTTIRMTPTVLMSTPSTCAVTAYLRIAPTAIRNREVPMVTQRFIDRTRRVATRVGARPGVLRQRAVDGQRDLVRHDGAGSPPRRRGSSRD